MLRASSLRRSAFRVTRFCRGCPGLAGRVAGERGRAAIDAYLYLMRTAGHISEHDELISKKLAYVMCGGNVPYGTEVSEEYLHDLEREAFLSLLGTAKTQERIRYTLQHGRPLRN